MKFKFLQIAALLLFCFASISTASVEWQTQKMLDINESPIDVATTSDGKKTFVLTDRGTVLIYSEDGSLEDKISVGKSIDGIEVTQKGNKLLLNSKKNKAVQIITLDYIYDIDSVGSPFKGPADAPVVIAVFSDFQ